MPQNFIHSAIEAVLYTYSIFARPLYRYRTGQRFRIIRNKIFTHSNASAFGGLGRDSIVASTCVLTNPKYIWIGENSTIGERTVLSAWDRYGPQAFAPLVRIGRKTSIGSDCHITAVHSIDIGNGVLFGRAITVTDNSHGRTDAFSPESPVTRPLVCKGAVVIEDNVWIGDKATILGGVTVGFGSIVAANSVVTKSVAPHMLVAGNPAVIKRHLGELPAEGAATFPHFAHNAPAEDRL
jgi:acetyltransferase-like isoleucine patch superfamily enzyme